MNSLYFSNCSLYFSMFVNLYEIDFSSRYIFVIVPDYDSEIFYRVCV